MYSHTVTHHHRPVAADSKKGIGKFWYEIATWYHFINFNPIIIEIMFFGSFSANQNTRFLKFMSLVSIIQRWRKKVMTHKLVSVTTDGAPEPWVLRDSANITGISQTSVVICVLGSLYIDLRWTFHIEERRCHWIFLNKINTTCL